MSVKSGQVHLHAFQTHTLQEENINQRRHLYTYATSIVPVETRLAIN